MASEAEKQFLAFDWRASQEWQKYFDNLYPTPPASRVLQYKKKWFRTNVNESLPMELTGDQPSTPIQGGSKTPTETSSSKPSIPHRNGQLVALSLTFLAFALFWTIAYILPIHTPGAFRWACFCYLGGFSIDVLVHQGIPQFNGAYWQRALAEESGQAAFMSLAGLGLQTWLVLLSPAITSVLLFAKMLPHWIWIVPNPLKPMANRWLTLVNSKTYQGMQMRANIEVMVGFTSILMIFSRTASFITCLLYWNALRLRYQANAFTQSTFRQIDGAVTRTLTSPRCPGVFSRGYGFIKTHLANLVKEPAA